MKSNRRWLAVVACLSLWCANVARAYTNLASAYEAMGFDPNVPGNSVVVFFSDPHMCVDTNAPSYLRTNIDHRLLSVVNGMVPRPAKIMVSGDVCTSLSAAPGVDGTAAPHILAWATEEMAYFGAEVKKFTNIDFADIVWMPGNHDQSPNETNADTFCRVFPDMPPNRAFDLNGTRFLMVNCGNYGDPPPVSREWLKAQVAATPPTQEVAVVTHQPPFHGMVAHRGLGLLLNDLFKDWQVRWWVLDGHEHARGLEVYDVGRSNVTQLTIAPASPNTFVGFTYDVGCIFLCLSNGIAGHVYYHYKDGNYELGKTPDWTSPKRYVAPFEETPNLLWRRLKSPILAPEMLVHRAYDSRDWWAYPDELQWSIHLDRHGNLATHFLVLMVGLTTTNIYRGPLPVFEFSPDRTNWTQMPFPGSTNFVFAFSIPPELRELPTIYARFATFQGDTNNGIPPDPGNNWIGGWGLSTTNTGPLITYPLLEGLPEQVATAGQLFTLDLPATDPYAPPDVLTFQLLSGPTNAFLDASTGRFEWLVPEDAPLGPTVVRVRVVDSATPTFSDTREYQLDIRSPAAAVLGITAWTEGSPVLTVLGKTGIIYDVLASDDLSSWTVIWTTNTTTTSFQCSDPLGTQGRQRFYRAVAR